MRATSVTLWNCRGDAVAASVVCFLRVRTGGVLSRVQVRYLY